MTLGFDVVAVDRDTADDTAAWISWTPPTGKQAGGDRIGRLVLAEGGGAFGSTAVRVHDYRGEPFAGAWFELWQDGIKMWAATTDSVGQSTALVPAGRYEARVASRGYRTRIAQQEVLAGGTVALDVSMEDLGTRFHVNDQASSGGDGSTQRPFRMIAEALAECSPGDTVQLAPGTYDQPLELIGDVTLLGAGVEKTRVVGEAHWGLALRPFISYFERGDESLGPVYLPNVVMKDFALVGDGRYPTRSAQEVSDLLAAVIAIGHRWLGTHATADDVATVRALLERNPELAKARILTPDADTAGSTLLHRVVSVYQDANDAEYEIAKLLIEHGGDVNAVGGQARGRGETALGYAGFFGDARLVELYLTQGLGDPNRVVSATTARATPVDATAHEGSHVLDASTYIPAFEALVQAGGQFDLGHLILLQHMERLEKVLHADPSRIHDSIPLRHHGREESGLPLHEAADSCFPEMVDYLLDRGADINAVDYRGWTPLQRALNAGQECTATIKRLVQRGAAADLVALVRVGAIDRAVTLLQQDSSLVNRAGLDGWTPLDVAELQEDASFVRLLRTAGGTLSQNVAALLAAADSNHAVFDILPEGRARDGVGYLHVDPVPSLDLRDQITLGAWVYLVKDCGTIIGKWNQDPGTWSYALHGVGPNCGFRLRWADGTQSNLRGFPIPYLQWVHYAATYDGVSMRAYVNGELVAERAVAGKRIASTSNPVWIGSSGYKGTMPGMIDDVQIWNVARSAEQIRDSMGGLTGKEPGLVGWWPLDEASTADRSSAGNHGRLAGRGTIRSHAIPEDGTHAPAHVLWLGSEEAEGQHRHPGHRATRLRRISPRSTTQVPAPGAIDSSGPML